MRRFLGAGLVGAVLALATPAQAQTAPYSRQPDIAAPDGRWDFASWDEAGHRLLVAHGKDALVIDPARADAVRVVGDLAGAHQVLALPGGDRLLATSGRDNSLRIIDLASGKQTASIAVADNPDAVILSPDGRRAYVMGAKAGAISVVDLGTLTETARIAVKPGLEVPVWVNPALLAVNDEDANEIELIDTAANTYAGAIALTGCEGPTGLAYAPAQHLALSACANGKAALVDLTRRQVVRLIAIGQGPDTAIWDARHARFLVPCGKSGTLSVIALAADGTVSVSSVDTARSARTGALDPASGRVYLPAATFAPAAAGQRPAMTPGSFRIVVMAPTD
jgi:YVTN family beta-propeller protein